MLSISFDRKLTVYLSAQCGDSRASSVILSDLHSVLKSSESCAIKSPCLEHQAVECQVKQTAREFYTNMGSSDAMLLRVTTVLIPHGSGGYEGKDVPSVPWNIIFLFLIYGLVLASGFAAMFALWRQNLLRQTFALPTTNRKKLLVYPVVMALICVVAVAILGYLLNTMLPWVAPAGANILENMSSSLPVMLLLAVIIAPLTEELLFRGIMLRFFVERGHLIIGTLAVSTVFSFIHGFVAGNIVWQVFLSGTYFSLSVVMCWLYIKNKSLWSPIIFHSAYNSVICLVYFLTR